MNPTMPENDALFRSLQALAEDIAPDAQFKYKLEDDLKSAHQPRASFHINRRDVLQFAGLALALAALAIFLSWAIRSLLPNRVPAGYEASTPSPVLATPTLTLSGQGTPIPQGQGFEYNGTMLYLNVDLPSLPTEANVYLTLPDQHATVESARALALRFGIQGQVYETPGEVPGTTDYMVTAGGPRIYVRSNNYFAYYREYGGNFIGGRTLTDEQAAASIAEFMQSHGFGFEYRLERAPQIYGEYYVVPLLDDLPLRYDYLMPARLDITLDENAEVMSVYGALIDTQKVGAYGIRSAEEALQKIIGFTDVGIQQTMRWGGMLNEQLWQRAYPDNEPIMLYGEVRIFRPAEAGGVPLFTLQEHPLTGNTAGLEAVQEGVFVEASGQFTIQDDVRLFEVASWTYSSGQSTSLTGALRTEGGGFILFSDGKDYPLADVPVNVPLGTQPPDEQVIVSGFLVDGRMEWTMIQYFPPGNNGGGGGGGGSGFYELNLSGTPMPLPTPVPTVPSTGGGGGGGGGGSGYMYTVVAGDTCQGIAATFEVSVEDLIAENGLPADCSTLQVDQTLTIQVPSPSLPETVEGLRGMLMVNQYNRPDGSQRMEYALITANPDYPYVLLEGDGLDALKGYRNRPVDVWGALEMDASQFALVVKVDKFEIPFPDLNFQILKGTEKIVEVENQTVLLFTTKDGQTFLELNSDCNSPAGAESALSANETAIQAETLAIPSQAWGGYPTVCMFSKAPTLDPSGQPIELQVTSDQVYVMEDPITNVPPTMTIEKVELVYYITDPRYPAAGASSSPAYVQPMWRFYGHYSNGDEFEFLVQALKDEFLSPVILTVQPPG